MIPRALLILVIVLTGLSPLSSPAQDRRAVDGRVTVASNTHPWASIGRLNVAGFRVRRHCTAALVSTDLVLTARHCLTGLGGGVWADPSKVHFLAGYARGRFSAHRTASGYIPVGREATLVRLSAPVDLPPLPIHDGSAPPTGAALAQAGYSADKSHVLTVDPACSFLGARPGGRWRHDCEAVSGDSGSPLLIDRPGGLSIAAIHVGRIDGVGDAEPVPAERIAAAQ